VKRILWILAFVAIASSLSGCPTTPPSPPHNCLSYWGDSATQLVPLLNAMKESKEGGPGWARRIPGDADYQALLDLKTDLEFALGMTSPPALPRMDPPLVPSVGEIVTCANLMRVGPPLVDPSGLQGDKNCGRHGVPAVSGWLILPDGSNGLAVNKAWQVWTALHDALDM
jgi:hypothetical protein